MEVDAAGPPRVYCPVPGCVQGDAARAKGWADNNSMRAHIDAHLAGTLQGDVPTEWLRSQRRQRCGVCGLSVSCRHSIHPTCRPAARAAVDGGTPRAGSVHDLPSFSAIQAGGVRTLRHVPAAARSLWGKALSHALADVAQCNDERAWREFLMRPQCVLCSPPRGGRKHHKAAAAYTKDRLQRWLEGDRQALWEDRHRPARGAPRKRSAEQRRELATALAREGFDRKACDALVAEGLCPDTPETAEALRALHPSQPAVAVDTAALPLAHEVVPDEVAKALRAFPVDTAPGPPGLRVQHLRKARQPGDTLVLMEQLAAVVNLLARGQACAAAAPVLAGASLVAVPKPKGGVRPIAIGEVMRRLTGKCLMTAVREEARAFLWPAQLGVGVPAGAETAVHTARAWLSRQQAAGNRKVLLKLDFRNAFNCLSRQAMLATIASHFPTLARFAVWCYAQPTHLQFGGASTIMSAGGVQQGDPLGPLFVAATRQPLARMLREASVGLDLSFFYLDDGVLAGDVIAVASALHLRSAELGLELNLLKCELVSVGDFPEAALLPYFPRQLVSTPDGASRVQRSFELLGAPVGDDSYMAGHAAARVQAARPLLQALGELEDPQVGLRLLRSCAGHCKLTHSLRCAPLFGENASLSEFDVLVRDCFSGLTGLHLADVQWEQAARDLAHAGLGLRSVARDAPAAYLASVGGCAQACRELDPGYAASGLASDPTVLLAASSFSALLAQPLASHLALGMRQKALTALCDAASWSQHLFFFFSPRTFFCWSRRSQCSATARLASLHGRRLAMGGGMAESTRTSLRSGGSPSTLAVPPSGSDRRLAAKVRAAAKEMRDDQRSRWQGRPAPGSEQASGRS